jgi:hypothetical protein
MLKFVAMRFPRYKKYSDGGTTTTGGYDATPDIISGVGTALGGVAGLFGTGKKAQGQQQTNIDAAAGDISDFYGKAAAGGYDYNFSLDPAYQDLYEMSKQRVDTDPMQQAQAAGLQALEGGGSRTLLAGLNPLLQGTAQMETQAQQQQLESEMKGLANLGQQRQQLTTAAEEANQAFQRDLGMRQLGQAEQAQAQGQQNLEAMKQQRQGAFGNILGGIGSAVAGALLNKEFGGLVPEMEYGGKLYEDGGATNPGLQALQEDHPEVYEKITGKKAEYGMKIMQMGGIMEQIMAAQGQPPVQGPLPGEASHETNPIHMINNQGEKVAEAMGGEFIINDKQAELIVEDYKAIEEALAEGREPTKDELMELYESCKQVFGQPQFETDEEAEMQMT